ncbi:MAG: type II toxin-antitoxin system VapC family toxin [Gammaproteobacteria bacterium]|nr:type II toxin-antitoxin system VapC family toxin [Gammaproteobacteria bacterium]
MKLLLDTQIALWWLTGSKRLKPRVKRQIMEAACYLSVASLWEVANKFQIGKLPIPPETYRLEMLNAGVTMLPILDTHVLALTQNDPNHRDPFDNLLLAVARAEQLKLLTSDARMLAVGAGVTLNAG